MPICVELYPKSFGPLATYLKNHLVPKDLIKFFPHKRDLRKKLECLRQGNKSIHQCYAEFQKYIIHCEIVEGTVDKTVCFLWWFKA
jgi:hypothetical protein